MSACRTGTLRGWSLTLRTGAGPERRSPRRLRRPRYHSIGRPRTRCPSARTGTVRSSSRRKQRLERRCRSMRTKWTAATTCRPTPRCRR
jgi:hypothetical protein